VTVKHRRFLAVVALVAAVAAFASPALLRRYLSTHPRVGRQMQARSRGAQFVTDSGVVLQQTYSDCGAAALSMTLQLFGVTRSRTSLVSELHTGPAGTTLYEMRLAAERAGVHARSWRLRRSDVSIVPLPAIAWVNGNHFVVVRRRLDATRLEVDDPAIGTLIWPIASFVQHWSGEALVFFPTWVPPAA
jgi:ABC-type bacteriocin/lantibiotic exporter with double-glycine peptidase domain